MSIDRARIHAAVDALLDAMEAMIADIRQPAPLTTPERPTKTAGLTKKELGAAIGKSTSTIDRFDREGAPHAFVGDTKRYDLDGYLDWLLVRGKKATKARPRSGDIDITEVAAAAGLRPTGLR